MVYLCYVMYWTLMVMMVRLYYWYGNHGYHGIEMGRGIGIEVTGMGGYRDMVG